MSKNTFILLSVAMELGLFSLAFVFGWLTDTAPQEHFNPSLMVIPYTLLATIPFFAVSYFTTNLNMESFKSIKNYLVDGLGPLLNKMNHLELFILGIFVGCCEETLFRGFAQPYFETITGSYLAGLVIVNIFFAILHPVSKTYIIYVFLAGIYLGLLLDITGSRELSLPIMVHGVYDWAMFLVIRFEYERKYLDPEESE